MNNQKYRGSCHCKKISFEVLLDLTKGSSRCNCSYCAKVRNWSMIIAPTDFHFLSGESEFTQYKFRTDSTIEHFFCRTCGVRILAKGNAKELGGDFLSLNLTSLDHIDASTFAQIPIQYMDGLHNNWRSSPNHTSYL